MLEPDCITDEIMLTVLTGDERGRIIVKDARAPFVLGRGEEADIQLSPNDPCISRTHIQIARCAEGWRLSALGGTANSTRINGIGSLRACLADEDIIQLGETRLKVSLEAGSRERLCCSECGEDVSAHGNSDGRALELADAVLYLCSKHFIKRGDVAGISLGKYEICSELGRGGAGIVYKVYDRGTARVLALKRIFDLQNVERIRRFDREMSEMKSIRHTNIIRFVDSGVDDEGLPYLVTEFAPDGSLADLAARHSYRLPPQAAIDLFIGVLDGLKYLHSLDDIHRDIKPQNILLRKIKDTSGVTKYFPKIADLGLVKKLHGIRITRPNVASGTVDFMPPEQLINFPGLDARADVYSLGASLYYVLTGSLPIDLPDNDHEPEQLECVVHAERIPVRRRLPELPPRLAAIVDKACRKDPDRRFQSSEEFQKALVEER